MPTIRENKLQWDARHDWRKDGDEWDSMAAYCKQPYEEWKHSVIETFITPNIPLHATVLEVAPGHGRWTEFIVRAAGHVILVDVSPSCINYCMKRFARHENIEYYVNDGESLEFLKTDSINFGWSFDSFVHMNRDVISAYFREFARALKPGGKVIVHHAGRRHSTLWLGFLLRLGRPGRLVYQTISMNLISKTDGWRSNVSKKLVRHLAEENGLRIETQIQGWGHASQYNVGRFRDYITTLSKPPA